MDIHAQHAAHLHTVLHTHTGAMPPVELQGYLFFQGLNAYEISPMVWRGSPSPVKPSINNHIGAAALQVLAQDFQGEGGGTVCCHLLCLVLTKQVWVDSFRVLPLLSTTCWWLCI